MFADLTESVAMRRVSVGEPCDRHEVRSNGHGTQSISCLESLIKSRLNSSGMLERQPFAVHWVPSSWNNALKRSANWICVANISGWHHWCLQRHLQSDKLYLTSVYQTVPRCCILFEKNVQTEWCKFTWIVYKFGPKFDFNDSKL